MGGRMQSSRRTSEGERGRAREAACGRGVWQRKQAVRCLHVSTRMETHKADALALGALVPMLCCPCCAASLLLCLLCKRCAQAAGPQGGADAHV